HRNRSRLHVWPKVWTLCQRPFVRSLLKPALKRLGCLSYFLISCDSMLTYIVFVPISGSVPFHFSFFKPYFNSQSSVLKAEAGKPSELNKLGNAPLVKAKRTADGFLTFKEDTIT